MRAGPCGLLGSVEQVMRVAGRQAAVTHNTPNGMAAAQAAALMTHYMLHRVGERRDLPDFLHRHLPHQDWRVPHTGEVGPKGVDSVRAALTALVRNDSLADLLIDCVEFGGDVDTVATIATAAAACASDIDQTIPTVLWEGLENGPFGMDYLVTVDDQLAVFARAQGAPIDDESATPPH